VWGGNTRERLLRQALGAHYRSVLRRDWQLAPEPPHFFDHRIDAFNLMTATGAVGPLSRGFYALEVMQPGDVVLDIGCGDGFFDRAFFAAAVGHVDAIDIEPSAIEHAGRFSAAPNVSYFQLDAVAQPFPRAEYDVVVWDGALGHFAPETTALMLDKIARVLKPGGVFVGSESLGFEGDDHLQWFQDVGRLRAVFGDHFQHVELRDMRYVILAGRERHEAFWRCAASDERLRQLDWRPATA
jgi:SAM-dependent methyltransferase